MEPNVYDILEEIQQTLNTVVVPALNSLYEAQKQQTILLNAILRQVVPSPAAFLQFTWNNGGIMPVTLNPGQSVTGTVSPVDAQGNPSQATLSNLSFSSGDSSVFTCAPTPGVANGVTVTAQTPTTMPDAAVITATATATEPDGVTTESVSGTDTITVQAATPPPPPPSPAASLVFSWGTPQAKK